MKPGRCIYIIKKLCKLIFYKKSILAKSSEDTLAPSMVIHKTPAKSKSIIGIPVILEVTISSIFVVIKIFSILLTELPAISSALLYILLLFHLLFFIVILFEILYVLKNLL